MAEQVVDPLHEWVYWRPVLSGLIPINGQAFWKLEKIIG